MKAKILAIVLMLMCTLGMRAWHADKKDTNKDGKPDIWTLRSGEAIEADYLTTMDIEISYVDNDAERASYATIALILSMKKDGQRAKVWGENFVDGTYQDNISIMFDKHANAFVSDKALINKVELSDKERQSIAGAAKGRDFVGDMMTNGMNGMIGMMYAAALIAQMPETYRIELKFEDVDENNIPSENKLERQKKFINILSSSELSSLHVGGKGDLIGGLFVIFKGLSLVKSYTTAKVFRDIFEDMAKYVKYPSSFKVSSVKDGGTSTNPSKPSTPTTTKPKSKTVQTTSSTALTIKDILYNPYGLTSQILNSEEKTKSALTEKYGRYERINAIGTGLHNDSTYNYTYNNVPIGVCYTDWYGDGNKPRTFYRFFVETKAEADNLYNSLVNDIKKAGIPMAKDDVYDGMANRKNPTKTLKEVFVETPTQVTKKDWANIVNNKKWVGMYLVHVGVYRR